PGKMPHVAKDDQLAASRTLLLTITSSQCEGAQDITLAEGGLELLSPLLPHFRQLFMGIFKAFPERAGVIRNTPGKKDERPAEAVICNSHHSHPAARAKASQHFSDATNVPLKFRLSHTVFHGGRFCQVKKYNGVLALCSERCSAE